MLYQSCTKLYGATARSSTILEGCLDVLGANTRQPVSLDVELGVLKAGV